MPRRPPRGSSALLALGAATLAACGPPQGEVSSAPIAVSTDAGVYAIGGSATTKEGLLLIDTGTVLTTRAEDISPGRIIQDDLSLYSLPGAAPVRRAEFINVPILRARLHDVGVEPALFHFAGILGGDLLQRFVVGLDYAASTITLEPEEPACSCLLADRRGGDGAPESCDAVLPFTLAGGGSVALGDQVHSYPPTRVTLDACLEAVTDPLRRAAPVPCVTRGADGRMTHNRGYEYDQPPGVDVRLLVATGFNGIILGASAWDRLAVARGGMRGDAAARLAAPTAWLRFAGRPPADVPPGQPTGVPAAQATLGDVPCKDDPGSPCTALTLVGREGLLGACGELARSRRLRWQATHDALAGDDAPPDCRRGDTDCRNMNGCLRCIPSNVCGDPNRCNDANQAVAAAIELGGPIPVFIVDDTAPILQEVNSDVRPTLSDVEGVVGTELLRRLAARIDYPRRRVIARCADGADGCTTYPRYVCPDKVNDCGPRGVDAERLCNPPSSLRELQARYGDALCVPAPNP